MPNPNPKTDQLTSFTPNNPKGSLDKRKLTVRLYTPERDQTEALAEKHGLKPGVISRILMEYALKHVDEIDFQGGG